MGSPSRRLKGASGNIQEVDDHGAASVVVHPYPASGLPIIEFPFVDNFKDSNGSSSLAVNGSSTNVVFSISAVSDYDIYISEIQIIIADTGTLALNKFGDLSALTNGVRCLWNVNPEGSVVLSDNMKMVRDFIQFGNATIGFGDGVNAFLADVSGGGTEKAYLPAVDFTKKFGMRDGLKLTRGSSDSITFIVRDDLTGLTAFNITANGKKIK